MSLSDSTVGLIALWLIPGLGPVRIKNLLDRFSHVESIFNATQNQLLEAADLDRSIAGQIPRALDSESLRQELKLIKQHGVDVIDIFDQRYPELLREIYSAPPLFYQKGEVAFNHGFYIGFVGSRKASYSGKTICQRIIKELAAHRPDAAIVSGLALGIDSAAHNAALENGLKTVAVLANGLSSVYPARNQKLSEQICSQGALISEFPMSTKPTPTNFPLRNRIISGLCKGVVVVEAGERSGATITAGYALEQNRELFALPGTADSQFHKGTNRLIQRGQAKLILNAQDILEEFAPINQQLSDQELLKSLSEDTYVLNKEEQKVMDILEGGCVQKDTIASKTGIPIKELLPILTSLEIKGLIISKPGAVYERKYQS